jgi:hypothetical protein
VPIAESDVDENLVAVRFGLRDDAVLVAAVVRADGDTRDLARAEPGKDLQQNLPLLGRRPFDRRLHRTHGCIR